MELAFCPRGHHGHDNAEQYVAYTAAPCCGSPESARHTMAELTPCRASGFAQERIPPTMASICLSVSIPPALCAKAGIGVPGTPLERSGESRRRRQWRGKRDRQEEWLLPPCLGPMASRAVLRIESVEVQHLAGGTTFEYRPGRPGEFWQAAQTSSGEPATTTKDQTVTFIAACPRSFLSSHHSLALQCPRESAKGRCCQVAMRCCLETTRPATRPNPI